MDQATITAACVALARANVPPYVQELLLYGDPSREIPPGALRKALEAALSSLERELAEAREAAAPLVARAEGICSFHHQDGSIDHNWRLSDDNFALVPYGELRALKRFLSTAPGSHAGDQRDDELDR